MGGGKSVRMNTDKAFLKYSGKSLIDITIECTSALFDKVFLVGRVYKHLLLSGCFDDKIHGIGPLGGIYTALKRTDKEYNFFIGVDYPFIDREMIVYLAYLTIKKAPLYDGCIPVAPDGMHPLFAFYGKSCLSSVTRCIAEKNYSIRCIARYSKIYVVSLIDEMGETNINKIKKNFTNINNYEEYLFSK